MKTLIVACASVLVLGSASVSVAVANSNDTNELDQAANLQVMKSDFAFIENTRWEGELSYLDYSSGEISAIPIAIEVKSATERTLSYAIQYPGETQYNAKEKLKISKDRTRLNGAKVVDREVLAQGGVRITTQERGEDDGRPADIQMIYVMTADEFIIAKDVRVDGEDIYFNRNIYDLKK